MWVHHVESIVPFFAVIFSFPSCLTQKMFYIINFFFPHGRLARMFNVVLVWPNVLVFGAFGTALDHACGNSRVK